MTIVLIIGIAKPFVDILVQMPPDLLKQAQLVTAVFILMLVAEKTPDLVAHIVGSMEGGQGGTVKPSQGRRHDCCLSDWRAAGACAQA